MYSDSESIFQLCHIKIATCVSKFGVNTVSLYDFKALSPKLTPRIKEIYIFDGLD